MFATRRSPWGPLIVITYIIALLLILPYLIAFYNDQISTHSLTVLIAFVVGIAGVVIIAVTQTRPVYKTIELELNLRVGAFGSGLMGAAFILMQVIHIQAAIIPTGLKWLGLISGILMAMGILTG